MDFKTFGKEGSPALMLIPGLGVSYEIFLPLIRILEDRFHIIAVQVDGFTLGCKTDFTSVDDQAIQVIDYIKENYRGKILSHVLERNEVAVPFSLFRCSP